MCAKRKNTKVWRWVKTISAYNPTAKRQQKPNLQMMTVRGAVADRLGVPDGSRMRACTKCIKSLGKR